jgi:hypothetical protein
MSSSKWEYQITQVTFHTPPIDLTKPKSIDAIESMQKMGENGWELINMIQQNMLFTFFWKREKKKGGESWTN